MLSDNDIYKYLGRRIGIYPLSEESIQGSCVELSTSDMAWSVNTKGNCCSDGKIVIHPHESIIVLTKETVYVDNKFAGYCLLKVSIQANGIASICAPVKPGWIGKLFVRLYNTSDEEYEIEVGKRFIVMTVHKLRAKCGESTAKANARPDLLSNLGIRLSNEEQTRINRGYNADPKKLFKEMHKDEIYKEIIKSKKRTIKAIIPIFFIMLLVLIAVIVNAFMKEQPFANVLTTITIAVLTAFCTAYFTMKLS